MRGKGVRELEGLCGKIFLGVGEKEILLVMKIVAIGGGSGSGKSVVATILRKLG